MNYILNILFSISFWKGFIYFVCIFRCLVPFTLPCVGLRYNNCKDMTNSRVGAGKLGIIYKTWLYSVSLPGDSVLEEKSSSWAHQSTNW